MYGERGKIGVIVPSLNNTLEPEFNRMAMGRETQLGGDDH